MGQIARDINISVGRPQKGACRKTPEGNSAVKRMGLAPDALDLLLKLALHGHCGVHKLRVVPEQLGRQKGGSVTACQLNQWYPPCPKAAASVPTRLCACHRTCFSSRRASLVSSASSAMRESLVAPSFELLSCQPRARSHCATVSGTWNSCRASSSRLVTLSTPAKRNQAGADQTKSALTGRRAGVQVLGGTKLR